MSAFFLCTQLFLALFLIFNITTAQTEPAAAKDIFILSGQSNMVGDGGIYYGENNQQVWDGFVPPDNTPDPSKVFRFTANLGWEVARDPLHIDIDVAPGKVVGVGPGMTFANAVKGTLGHPVGLVPCAIGGTPISEWTRGKPNYENMIKRAKAAASSGGNIKALLWYQGESDTHKDETVNAFHDNLVNFMVNVRADLGLPNLPIIHVAIATGSNVGMMKIRDIQKGIQLPNVACVDALGLEIGGDHVHLATSAQVKLGHMFADAYRQLAKTSSSPPV